MKVSEIDEICVIDYLKLNEDIEEMEDSEIRLLKIMRKAAVSYAMNVTGLTKEQMDTKEDISIAVLTLIQDMYDNRRLYVDNKNVNMVVSNILSQHSENLL